MAKATETLTVTLTLPDGFTEAINGLADALRSFGDTVSDGSLADALREWHEGSTGYVTDSEGQTSPKTC